MSWIRSTIVILLASGTLPAQQGATVDGKVVSILKGEPVRGATVVLRSTVDFQGGTTPSPVLPNYVTETDAYGHFRLIGVAPGTYTCVPQRQGFGSQPPDQLPPAASPVLNLKDGDHVTGVVARLTPLGVISGHVFDPEGDPISGAEIEALQYGYARGARSLEVRLILRSDDRGEFRLFNLFPGQYYLRASKPDAPRLHFGGELRGAQPPLSYSTIYYPSTADAARAAPLDLPAAGELRGIDFRLSRSGLYSIRGKLSHGNPETAWADMNLTLQKRPREPGFFPRAGMEVSTQGYHFPNVTPGSYVIEATLNDPASDKRVLVARQFVEVINQDVNADLNFTPGLEVSGSVRGGGVAVSRLQVVLIPMEEGAPPVKTNQVGNSKRTAVNVDGSFVLSNLLPDLYQLRVIPFDVAYVSSMKVGDQELADQRLDLTRGVVGAVSIVVAADVGSIVGTVKDEQGRKVAQANVFLIPDDTRSDWLDRYNNYVTEAEGRFLFNNVEPGNYQLFAWQDDPRGAPISPEFRKPFERYALPVKVEPGVHVDVDVKLIPNKQQTGVNQ